MLIRHDLSVNLSEVKVEPTSPISLHSSAEARLELSPASNKIRSLLTSSSKKLKGSLMIQSPVKRIDTTESKGKIKKPSETLTIIEPLKGIHGSAQARIFESWRSKKLENSKSSGLRNQEARTLPKLLSDASSRKKHQIKGFEVAPPLTSSGHAGRLEEIFEGQSKFEIVKKSEDQEVTQLKRQVKTLLQTKPQNSPAEVKFEGKAQLVERNFRAKKRLDRDSSPSSSQSSDLAESNLGSLIFKNRMSELELLTQFKAEKEKRLKKFLNKAIKHEEEAEEAERYAKGVLQKSIATRTKADKIAKDVEDLGLQIQEVRARLQLETVKSSD